MTETKQQVKEITEKLEQGVKDIFDSHNYKDYLAFMAKFYDYSFNNTILIWMQKPDASLVAGYKAWQTKFHRNVKKGEKAIKILAPVPRKGVKQTKNADGELEDEEYTYMMYRAVNVFDISQTEGEEVPSFTIDELTGEVERFSELLEGIEKVSKIPVEYIDIAGSAKGFYSPADNKIAIQKGMSQEQTIKTLIHETAHSILHCKGGEEEKADRRTMEVQAESIAYTVCCYLGIDTSDYSFGYVTGWSAGKECKELTASMEIIRKTATDIIKGVAA